MEVTDRPTDIIPPKSVFQTLGGLKLRDIKISKSNFSMITKLSLCIVHIQNSNKKITEFDRDCSDVSGILLVFFLIISPQTCTSYYKRWLGHAFFRYTDAGQCNYGYNVITIFLFRKVIPRGKLSETKTMPNSTWINFLVILKLQSMQQKKDNFF